MPCMQQSSYSALQLSCYNISWPSSLLGVAWRGPCSVLMPCPDATKKQRVRLALVIMSSVSVSLFKRSGQCRAEIGHKWCLSGLGCSLHALTSL